MPLLELKLAVVKYIIGWQIGKDDSSTSYASAAFKSKDSALQMAAKLAALHPQSKWFVSPSVYETSNERFAQTYALKDSSGNPLIFDSAIHSKEYVN